jgi:hypothetical protein
LVSLLDVVLGPTRRVRMRCIQPRRFWSQDALTCAMAYRVD